MMKTNEVSKRYLAKRENGLVIVEERCIERTIIIEAVNQLNDLREKFVLLSVYEGIVGKDFCELVNLTYDDVSENVLTLCSGRKITVSNDLVNIIIDLNKDAIDNSQTIISFNNENLSEFEKGKRIYAMLERIFKKINI